MFGRYSRSLTNRSGSTFRDMGAAPDEAARRVVRDRYGIQRA